MWLVCCESLVWYSAFISSWIMLMTRRRWPIDLTLPTPALSIGPFVQLMSYINAAAHNVATSLANHSSYSANKLVYRKDVQTSIHTQTLLTGMLCRVSGMVVIWTILGFRQGFLHRVCDNGFIYGYMGG